MRRVLCVCVVLPEGAPYLWLHMRALTPLPAPQLRGRCTQSESQTAGVEGEEQLSREDIHSIKKVFFDDSGLKTASKQYFFFANATFPI